MVGAIAWIGDLLLKRREQEYSELRELQKREYRERVGKAEPEAQPPEDSN